MDNVTSTITQSWFWQYFLSHFGWVDWMLTAFLLVGLILGLKNGASQELPRLVESAAAIYVTFEYHPLISDWLARETPCPEAYARVIAFGFVGFASWFLLRLSFEIIGKFIHLEIVKPFQILGGALIGGLRYALFFSFISYLLVLLPLDWIHRSYEVQSWSGQTLRQIPPQVYEGVKEFVFRKGPETPVL